MKLANFLIFIFLSTLISCKSNEKASEKNTIKNKDVVLLTSDFKQKENTIPFYREKRRNALALNAGRYKNKFTAAIGVFTGNKGRYNINLTTIKEIDGESTYRIFIDGKLIKELQNPETEVDFQEHILSIQNVKLKQGADLEIQFNSHSNGKIPENGGFAFSRGRWKKIEFIALN